MHPVARALMQGYDDGRTYLYNEGDECTSLTGGWDNSYTITAFTHSQLTLATSQMTGSLSGKKQVAYRVTTNTVNTTNYDTLHIKWSHTTTGSGTSMTVLLNTNLVHGNYVSILQNTGSSGTTVTETLDISSANGSYYIVVYLSIAYTSRVVSGTIDRIWMT